MTLDEAITLFIADRKSRHCGIHAIKAYTQHLTRFANFACNKETIALETITPSHIAEFAAQLQNSQLSSTTVRQRLSHIKTFFKWAHTTRHITSDPSETLHIRKPPRPLPKCLNPQEIKTLAATELPTRDKAIIFLILDSGIRRSEIAELQLDDIDLTRSIAHVRHGKGDKERYVLFAEKTHTALLAWIQTRNAQPGVDRLFTTKHGLAMQPGGIYKAVKRSAAKAAIYATPHRLRHSFAKNYLDRGGNLHDLQCLMGHESITTTMIYVSVSLESLRQKHHQFSLLDNL